MFNTSGIEFTLPRRRTVLRSYQWLSAYLLYDALHHRRSHGHVERVLRGTAAGFSGWPDLSSSHRGDALCDSDRPHRGKWLFGEVFCNIFIAMDVMCCTASIMTLCVISVDRFAEGFLYVYVNMDNVALDEWSLV
ncbi:hypothetical protein KUCAC02_029577 [Chaenocephalus aceratus]|nr:hypothetical protein KUCAC02_029577 [Chaenocephalus aceratus]